MIVQSSKTALKEFLFGFWGKVRYEGVSGEAQTRTNMRLFPGKQFSLD